MASCDPSKRATGADGSVGEYWEKPAGAIVDQLLLQLAVKADPQELVVDFSDIGMEYRELVSAPMRIHLFTYDTERMAPSEVIDHVMASALVEQAEFNKQLNSRD